MYKPHIDDKAAVRTVKTGKGQALPPVIDTLRAGKYAVRCVHRGLPLPGFYAYDFFCAAGKNSVAGCNWEFPAFDVVLVYCLLQVAKKPVFVDGL